MCLVGITSNVTGRFLFKAISCTRLISDFIASATTICNYNIYLYCLLYNKWGKQSSYLHVWGEQITTPLWKGRKRRLENGWYEEIVQSNFKFSALEEHLTLQTVVFACFHAWRQYWHLNMSNAINLQKKMCYTSSFMVFYFSTFYCFLLMNRSLGIIFHGFVSMKWS